MLGAVRGAGSRRDRIGSNTSVTPAEKKYTVRQPPTSASAPDKVRASSNPSTTPPCAVPTTRPRSCGAARAAANAISPCVMAVPSSPTSNIPASSQAALCAQPTSSSAPISPSCCPASNRCRFNRSPSGTTNSNASAQPN